MLFISVYKMKLYPQRSCTFIDAVQTDSHFTWIFEQEHLCLHSFLNFRKLLTSASLRACDHQLPLHGTKTILHNQQEESIKIRNGFQLLLDRCYKYHCSHSLVRANATKLQSTEGHLRLTNLNSHVYFLKFIISFNLLGLSTFLYAVWPIRVLFNFEMTKFKLHRLGNSDFFLDWKNIRKVRLSCRMLSAI